MNKKQKIIIAVMAVIGLLLAAWILAPKQAGESHDDHGHDGKEKAPAKAAAAPPAGELAHADGEVPEKIVLDAAQVKAAGIALAAAAPAKISVVTSLPGEIRFNEDRTAHVVPKLAGVVMEVHADLGQSVKQGQVLAVIASSGLSDQRSELLSAQRRLALASTTLEREKRLWQDKISAEQDYLQAQQAMSEAEIAVQNARQKLSAIGAGVGSGTGSGSGKNLNRLELRAPFSGVVMEKHLAQGEAVKEDAIVFTLSDLSTVWAEIAVPPRDLNLMRVGETVTVKATAFAAEAKGKIIYVGELLGEQTRTAKARVALANPDRAWRPGLFITVDVLSGSANRNANAADAAVAVASDAVQMVEERPVVFVETAGGFLAQPVKLGRSDGKMTEVLAGLKPGVRYVATGSFVLKAELGKDSAEHTH
ncbi:UNVERIFIED_ORG: cobalt-zinc-cadmium efflux system membrane fusion protein [Zoogloea ramigera]|uniref:Efflux RND transporter periplasmic adaptor subunit n=1 Tax=Duganella zoogloeoides TaxID=75659 RepID=A0ABZ0XZX3_9BURK|nr:efflux RND transporter periplasmic adaptor subunit [Duganella zoogloeoides]WQH04717.1 efflux RND transporter periplasmic adaptor subunit [Duganella zoogloeoides]